MESAELATIRARFEETQRKSRERAAGNYITRLLRGLSDRIAPPLKVLNDYGNPALSVYKAPTNAEGIAKFNDDIHNVVTVMSNQKAGRDLKTGLE